MGKNYFPKISEGKEPYYPLKYLNAYFKHYEVAPDHIPISISRLAEFNQLIMEDGPLHVTTRSGSVQLLDSPVAYGDRIGTSVLVNLH